jgi:hypothetical protein
MVSLGQIYTRVSVGRMMQTTARWFREVLAERLLGKLGFLILNLISVSS